MRTRRTVVAAVSVAVAAALSAPALASADGRDGHDMNHRGHKALTAVGLTADQRLVEFTVDRPARTTDIGRVAGLRGDTKVVGIDFRVQDEKLYGVGDKGGVYTLNTANARATKVSQLTVALAGRQFGVDFNPAANRLRVISNTGQNLRHNIDDSAAPLGTMTDGTLTNPTTPPTTATGVTGAAYTNNDLNAATATTLFDIDTMADRVSLQSPANAGTLAPTGDLGVNAGPDAGFDIYFSPKHGTNRGFASLNTAGTARLYEVDVLTGAARDLGAFSQRRQVTDLALPLEQG
ncbi:DUF4394 domain-containing protein [Streptomyces sp. MBT56]|uniref:DUF4394 domain-containing protein n=1 Tax=unclassified Streptomyces TaxID=2593676 RepID=UPI00190B9EEB|nr:MULTISPECIES: DUF4394 domain-containing protein [unclassified Streptomyces]MBK3557589.1 DUF4394 domain-containing protein [Streptomyces sp. MBT56]MBK3606238.1 DUF4394 domain-containing protein [Streptomyces sp. MBT54]MBK3615093.1 DUF4394 domain-containing protein [Streptomyces sp. MBT98]MBK6042364.1 DUF4394 domain-containing protein [Streptomyces sp. MBT55]